MSIIERAANKIGQLESTEPGAPDVKPIKELTQPLVEAAARRQHQAAPVVPDSPAPEGTRPEQREPTSPVSIRGTINLAKLEKAGMIVPNAEKTQLAEEFRLIKRPLLGNAFGQGAAAIRNGNLVMVTSALPGEGKSFCSINLAMSIAMEMDHTVLLVDADVAKPSIPAFLGLKAEKGLLDVLLDDELDLADVLIRTNVEKLTVLPAGRGHRYATELLASDAMDRLLQEMAQRYRDRILIFDSPPLLATSEARVLASHMGQIVMVVEANRTPQETVREALRQIESCDVVGLLLNKGNSLIGKGCYGGYGGYGGGYGGYGQ